MAGPITGPVTNRVAVREGGKTRTFMVTVEPANGGTPAAAVATAPAAAPAGGGGGGEPVFSTFAGKVEITDILVKQGDRVHKGGVIAQVEAMKATHDIKSPREGTVTAVLARIGDEIDSSVPIVTIA